MKDKKHKEKKQSSNPFIRGSQIFSHAVRMTTLGIRNTVLVSLGLVVVWLGFQCWRKLLPRDIYYLVNIIWSDLKLEIGKNFYQVEEIGITVYDFLIKQDKHMSVIEFQDRIWKSNIGQRLTVFKEWFFSSALNEAIIAFVLGIVATYIFFVLKGRKKMVKAKIRGNDLVESKVLAASIKKAYQASDINIGGVPIIKGSERYHTLITGTTGSGKTNLLYELLLQIEARGDKAVIFDLNATLVTLFFNRARGDLILNPFDARTVDWLPWVDCKLDYDYDALAASFITDDALHEQHWTKSAKHVFAEVLKRTKETQIMSELLNTLNTISLAEYSKFFEKSIVASATDSKGGKGTSSVRSTLSTCAHKLHYLSETANPFSIKDYVVNNDNKNWLFVTATPNQREALGSLLSSWLKIALNGIMQRNPLEPNKNVWFIVDELPAIDKIPSLKTMVSEVRKYGGCFVAGMQDVNQFFNDYGYYQSLNILNQFNTRFMFRANDKETAELSSKIIGQQEVEETKESLSYGANTIRDGVNLNTVKYIKDLVLPSEFMRLPDLSCYAKLQGDWPATKLLMELHKPQAKHPMFIARKKS